MISTNKMKYLFLVLFLCQYSVFSNAQDSEYKIIAVLPFDIGFKGEYEDVEKKRKQSYSGLMQLLIHSQLKRKQMKNKCLIEPQDVHKTRSLLEINNINVFDGYSKKDLGQILGVDLFITGLVEFELDISPPSFWNWLGTRDEYVHFKVDIYNSDDSSAFLSYKKLFLITNEYGGWGINITIGYTMVGNEKQAMNQVSRGVFRRLLYEWIRLYRYE